MGRNYILSYLTLEADPIKTAEMAARTGYDSIGVRLLPAFPGGKAFPLMDQPQNLKRTLKTMRSLGISVFDIEIIRLDGPLQRETAGRVIETAAELGARTIIAAGDDEDEIRLAQSFAELCELAAPAGLNISLEFTPWTNVPDAATALQVVKAAGIPQNADILVDTLHADRSATTLDDIRGLDQRLVRYCQICDGIKKLNISRDELISDARQARLLPGNGEIDLAAMLAAMPADIPISVEIPHLTLMPQMGEERWLTLALEKSREIAAQARVAASVTLPSSQARL